MNSRHPPLTTKHSVWLFTRPLKSITLLFGTSSHSKDQLSHWGVLISELSRVDGHAILSRSRGNNDTDLGTMYELFPDDTNRNILSITQPFRTSVLRNQWPMFSAQYVGQTAMTHEMIKENGTRSPSSLLTFSHRHNK
jgi:hypothetical protein